MDISDPRIPLQLLPAFSIRRVYGENQPGLLPLPSIVTRRGQVITRWSPSLEERAAIVRGEDIYVEIISGGIVHPIRVMIGPRDFTQL